MTAPVAVLGAGLAGLTAARRLRRLGCDVVVLERAGRVAGLAASEVDAPFVADIGAHFMTNRLAAAVGIGARCAPAHEYGETVIVGTRSYRYPSGLLREPRYVASAVRERLHRAPTAIDAATRFRAEYGAVLADEVAIPLVEAWSGRPAHELAAAVVDKIPAGLAHTLRLRLAGRVGRRPVAIGYCASAPEVAGVHHVYPRSGGIGAVAAALAAPLADVIRTGVDVEAIHVVDGRAAGVRVDGRDLDVAGVVSSLPIGRLAGLTAASTERLAAFGTLGFRGLCIVGLGIRGGPVLPDVVTWFPGRDVPFFRATEITRGTPWVAPAGTAAVMVDIGAQPGDATWTRDDGELVATVVEALGAWVPNLAGRVESAFVQRVPLGYPVFALEHEPIRRSLERGTGVRGLLSVGRNGEFGHWLMEDVYWRTLARVDAFVDSEVDLTVG